MQQSPTNDEKKTATGKASFPSTSLAIEPLPVKKEDSRLNLEEHIKSVDNSKGEGFKKGSSAVQKYKITEESVTQNSPNSKPDNGVGDNQPEHNLSIPPKSKEAPPFEENPSKIEEAKEIKKAESTKLIKPVEISKHEIESGGIICQEPQNKKDEEFSVSEVDNIKNPNEKRQSVGILPRKQMRKKEHDRLTDNDLHYLLEIERMKQKSMTEFMKCFCNNCMEIVKNSITSKVYA